MPDRKISELSVADSTDIQSSNAVLHLMNPDRALDADKNRKLELKNNVVLTTQNQTIGGTKTFSNTIVGDISGNANTVSRTVTAGSGLDGGGTLSGDITLSHTDTSSQASVNNSGNTVIQDVTLDTYGHVTGLGSTTLSIPSVANATITLTAGSGISGGGNFTTNQSTNETITFSHTDTSSQASVNNSSGTVIQDVTLDTYGHVTGLGSVNLDGRYYTESEANGRYYQRDYNANQDITTSATSYTATLPAMSVGQIQIYCGTWTKSGSSSCTWTARSPSGGTYIALYALRTITTSTSGAVFAYLTDTTFAGSTNFASFASAGANRVHIAILRIS